jgi:hypothetical protein
MNKSILISVLIIIIAGLLFITFHFYFADSEAEKNFLAKELLLKDSINNLQKEIDMSRIKQAKIQHDYDSMLKIEPQIIIKTNEKIKFIYGDASPDDLDSIIRSSTKKSKGHH